MLALKLHDLKNWVIYHPHPLKNPLAWDKEDFVFYDKRVDKLLKWKLRYLYNNWNPKIVKKEIEILNTTYTLEELEVPKNIPEDIKVILQEFEDTKKEYIADAVKKKLYGDLEYTIAVELLISEKKWIKLENVDKNNLEYLFSLPFKTFYKQAKRLIDRWEITNTDLDNIVIKKTSKYYYNPKLPVPYIPLLAREHVYTPDWNPWNPKLGQIYYLYHEVENTVNLLLSKRQYGKGGYVSLKWFQYRMADWTFKKAKDIKVWDKLLASDKRWYTNVVGISLTKEPVYKITLSNWAYYYATTEHQHVTAENYKNWKFVWPYKNTVELQKWDFIPYMHNIEIKWKHENIYKMKLLWYWLWDWTVASDSYVNTMSLEISCWTNQAYIDKLIQYAKYLWLKARVELDTRKQNHCVHIYWFDNMKDIYKNKSWTKYIPNFVFGLDKEWKRAVIEWLLWSDWYIQIKHNWVVTIEYCSKSEELIRGLQILLADVWVLSNIKSRFMKTNFNKHKWWDTYWYLYITDRQSVLDIFEHTNLDHKLNYEDAYNIITTNTKLSNSKHSIIPMIAKEEQKQVISWEEKVRLGIRNIQYNFQRRKAPYYWLEHWLKYHWVRVESIEKIGEEEVIHIQVDWDNLLWTGWVLTHNSLLTTLIAFQHLMMDWENSILYLVEAENKILPIMQYFERGLKKYKQAWIFSMSKNDYTITCKITGNVLKFMSAWSRTGVKGYSFKKVIIDEADYISDDVFFSLIPIFNKPGGKFYAVSTVAFDVKWGSTWFYDLAKDIELGLNKMIWDIPSQALTITLYEDEWVTKQQLQMFEIIRKRDPDRFLWDYMCIRWDQDTLWDKNKLISPISSDEYKKKNVINVLISLDPAKKYDYGGLVVSYIIEEDWKNYIVPVVADELEKMEYYQQIEIVKKYVDLALINQFPVNVIIDETGVWAAVSEMLKQQIPNAHLIKLMYTAGNNITEKNGAIYVPKKELVDTLSTLASEWEVKIPYDLKNLIEQLDTYRYVNGKYEAITWHDDVIESFLNTTFIYNYKLKKHLKLFWTSVNWQTDDIITIPPPSQTRQRLRKFLY